MSAITLGVAQLVECNLVIVQGCTANFEFAWTRGDPAEPVDLDGATALCHLRKSATSELAADFSPYVTLGSGGVISIDLPPGATADVPARSYMWDLIVTEQSGVVTRVAAGTVNLIDPISED